MLLPSREAMIELERSADDIADQLFRVERGIGHLEDELNFLQF